MEIEGTRSMANERALDKHVAAFFSKESAMVNLFPLVSFVGKMQYHRQSFISWCSIGFLLSLSLSFLIVLNGMDAIHQGAPGSRVERQCRMAYMSTVLRMLAASALLMFFDTGHAVVAGPLLVMFLALLWFFYKGTFVTGGSIATDMEQGLESINATQRRMFSYAREFKFLFELSAQVVSMAFGGLSGTVLGYIDGSSDLTTGYRAPECFLLYGIVIGLLVMLLTTVPPAILDPTSRDHVARVYLRILTYAALIFLVLAAIIAVHEILREYIFVAFFLVIFTALTCFFGEHKYGTTSWRIAEAQQDGEEESKALKHLHAWYFIPSFLTLTVSNVKYNIKRGSTISLSWWFKGFVFSALCSIMAYASRMVVFAETRDIRRSSFPKKTWTVVMYSTVVITVICSFCVQLLHPEEITNLF